jgi:sec-independent protein translocase protein TatB
VFDLSITKIAVLLVLAVVIFGPDQLPKLAQQAGRALRDLRRLADSATRDLKEGLGPEFADFDVTDLHPKNFVRKHLLDDDMNLDDLDPRKFVRKHLLDEPEVSQAGGASMAEPMPEDATATAVALLPPGETPPYDSEAT